MSEKATVSPVRRAVVVAKKPDLSPSLRLLARERERPASACQIGPSWRQVRDGM